MFFIVIALIERVVVVAAVCKRALFVKIVLDFPRPNYSIFTYLGTQFGTADRSDGL